jgi:hypothetical protein
MPSPEALGGFPQKNLKIQVLICVFLTSGYKIPRLSWLQKSWVFSGENLWFCAMNECLFWGKFWFENCTLLQKRALSAERGGAHPLHPPPGSAHEYTLLFTGCPTKELRGRKVARPVQLISVQILSIIVEPFDNRSYEAFEGFLGGVLHIW